MDSFDQELALESGLVSITLILDPIFNLLTALADLVKSCERDHRSMYQDTVYQHLNHHLLRASSNLIQAVFSWILDRVCGALLQSWQTWLGVQVACQPTVWGDEKDRLYRSLWSRHGIHADSQRSHRSTFDSLVDQPDQSGQTPLSYRVLSKLCSIYLCTHQPTLIVSPFTNTHTHTHTHPHLHTLKTLCPFPYDLGILFFFFFFFVRWHDVVQAGSTSEFLSHQPR